MSTHDFNLADAFLLCYLLELEKVLHNSSQLKNIKFQSEESNTDEFLKRFLKTYIEKNKKPNLLNDKSVRIKLFDKEKNFSQKLINECYISKVYLPEEIPSDIVNKLKNDSDSVYTNPDLLLIVESKQESFFRSIELKSTKNNLIPGSSVQQVSPFEWVVFLKRNSNNIDIATGLYINSIDDRLPFPDRSPRPIIGFNHLKSFNTSSRLVTNDEISIKFNDQSTYDKLILIQDWRDYLINEWMEVVSKSNVGKNERWFNYVIRKYSYSLLKEFSNKSSEEKLKFIRSLKKNITPDQEGFFD